jgi:hypothetical protein
LSDPRNGDAVDMPSDYTPFVRKVFEDTGPDNPLRKLSDYEKCVVVALVHVHLIADNTDKATETLDEIAAIAAEAADLAKKSELSYSVGN